MAIWFLLIAAWAIALCGLIDVASKPKQVFNEAGRSKRTWLILQAVGFLGLSVAICPYYFLAVRPKLLAAARRLSSERFTSELARIASTPPKPGSTPILWPPSKEQPKVIVPAQAKASAPAPKPAPATRPGQVETPPRMTCTNCNGEKTVTCWVCHGDGDLPLIPPVPGVPPRRVCWNCQYSGRKTCPRCEGTGLI